jgi:hypothetical protein
LSGHGLEGLLAALRRDVDRIRKPERQQSLGVDDRRLTASEKHSRDAQYPASRRADAGSQASGNSAADRSSHTAGDADRRSIPAYRRISLAIQQIRFHRHLLAVRQRQLGDFNTKMGDALGAPGLHGFCHCSDDGLAAVGHYQAVDNQRLLQYCREAVARLVMVARKGLRDSHG